MADTISSSNKDEQDKRAGATLDESHRSSSAHNQRQSLTKGRESSTGSAGGCGSNGAASGLGVERSNSAKELDRARLVRERQQEERQRKLEELRQQALAAQRFREQREEERRRRIEELRLRDNDRRSQVEERKRLIWEAERDRREAIMRKNQEREARIEAKRKNERSQIVFAFGSSTPRMLEPADTGGASFWGTRRATSTSNVMFTSLHQAASSGSAALAAAHHPTTLTRRSSERELDGSKKRATSAGGIERKPDMRMSSSMYEVFNWNSAPDPSLTPARATNKRASLSLPPVTDVFSIDDLSYIPTQRGDEGGVGATGAAAAAGEAATAAAGITTRYVNRRRTDLVPTLPSPREGREPLGGALAAGSSGRSSSLAASSSSKSFTRSPGLRSGEVTPNSPSRPHSSMSQQSASSSVASSTVNLRPRTSTPRRPRPASIAGTGVTTFQHNEAKQQKDAKPPLPKVHGSSAGTPRKPATPAANGNNGSNSVNASAAKPDRKSATTMTRSAKASPRVTPKPTPLQSPGIEVPPHEIADLPAKVEPLLPEEKREPPAASAAACDLKPARQEDATNESPQEREPKKEEPVVGAAGLGDKPTRLGDEQTREPLRLEKKEEAKVSGRKSPEPENKSEAADLEEQCDMTASMIQKIRITTEEEAKAALAERRRLAREQAEREAELERQRLEEEARLEAERLRAEEEEQRRLEEETIRLAEEARRAEEQRLQLAIEEAKRREEEDRKRREEELRQKLEKEEAERKAREEAEKQRLEMVERLKKEEEERNARRKRVEAIMLRTRAKTQPNAQKGEGNDGEKSKEDSPSEESKSGAGDDKSVQNLMTTSLLSEATQQLISSEQRAHEAHDADVVRNGTSRPSNGINDPATKQQQQQQQQQQLLLNNEEFNGHRNNGSSHGNGIDTQSIALDNATVKQNNVTNNLLDLSEFDLLSNSNSTPILVSNNNEDSVNSNLNATAIPFMPNFVIPAATNANPFQDPFVSNIQQDNQVQDLLS